MKKLTSLEEHNTKIRKNNWDDINDKPNGIECPECKNELSDKNPFDVLMSYPPKMRVICPSCGYHGYRLC